ncbi:hypothetical protein COW99_05705 [Candidatus Roizmanbacteria bacterium CG22_combo_CG10-13_8_21_14_all_38_20]|uniref:PrgI family protein n=1 Tax=Candidatus Roizmanbacteria bacterium CG22_combo_CG10-13_8_21_14_all_38_20 TaxID=1974862 RepID=A0A2H0BTY5_9BACT|nr:MAG: hypothetical protein COW99_05705 [Candidatus Roizmanbacteria bacterium CG22_combo_CG10-13_8_21_14_all_38_20]PJC32404.1 MAG: hypothetical protein CO050_00015 [Candidatus Roizmanbacteria bacterium CG_4_9_14_0_2_um_filter_38_17]
MQQHPIPRNVTSFQFKLVGDITLKQFGYLAAGAVLGYIAFRAIPGPGVLKFMVGIIIGSSGAAFAFAPIQGRPLDKWLMAFIKSVTTPTQFGWKRGKSLPMVMEPSFKFGTTNISSKQKVNSVTEEEMKSVDTKLNAYLANKKQQPHELIDDNEKKALHKTNTALSTKTTGAIISHQANLGRRTHSDAILDNTVMKPASQSVKTTIRSIEDILQERVEAPAEMPVIEAPAEMPPQEIQPTANTEVRVLETKAATGMGFVNAPTQLNALSAVILDTSGKPLPDILAIIKNEHKMIVRALKSNSLGQVVSHTPLANGTYYIELEDPKKMFVFDIIKTTLKGGMFQPIQIGAKSVVNKQPVEQDVSSVIKSKLFSN